MRCRGTHSGGVFVSADMLCENAVPLLPEIWYCIQAHKTMTKRLLHKTFPEKNSSKFGRQIARLYGKTVSLN